MPKDDYRQGRDRDAIKPRQNPEREPTRSQTERRPWVYVVYLENGERVSGAFALQEQANTEAEALRAKKGFACFVKAERVQTHPALRSSGSRTIGDWITRLRSEAGLLFAELQGFDRAITSLNAIKCTPDPSPEVAALLVENAHLLNSWGMCSAARKLAHIRREMKKIREVYQGSGIQDASFAAALDKAQEW